MPLQLIRGQSFVDAAENALYIPIWTTVKKNIKYLKIAIAVLLIYFLITSGRLDLSNLSTFLNSLQSMIFSTFSFLLLVLVYFITVVRWNILLKAQKINVSFMKALRFSFIGFFFNTALVGSLGGDFVKMCYVAREAKTERTKAIMTVIMDRIIGLTALVTLASMSCLSIIDIILSDKRLFSLAILTWGLLAALIFFFFLGLYYFSRENNIIFRVVQKCPFSEHILNVLRSINGYRHCKRHVVYAFFITIALQLISFFVLIAISRFLGETQIATVSYLFIIPLGFLTISLPITPGGIGVGQVAFLFLFNLLRGDSTSLGADAFTFYQILTIIVNLMGIFPFVAHKRELKDIERNTPNNQPPRVATLS